MAKMVCHIHDVKLFRTQTRYGGLWICPESECDVKCWEKKSSLPGTKEDFDERMATHKLFDSLWQSETGPFSDPVKNSRNNRRGRAYKWLKTTLSVRGGDAHIGMQRAEKCREVRAALTELVER